MEENNKQSTITTGEEGPPLSGGLSCLSVPPSLIVVGRILPPFPPIVVVGWLLPHLPSFSSDWLSFLPSLNGSLGSS